jgi:7-keto-8-aminopelargonate synthetase-like enzyme
VMTNLWVFLLTVWSHFTIHVEIEYKIAHFIKLSQLLYSVDFWGERGRFTALKKQSVF